MKVREPKWWTPTKLRINWHSFGVLEKNEEDRVKNESNEEKKEERSHKEKPFAIYDIIF